VAWIVDLTAQRDAEARVALIATVSESIGTSEDPAELLYEVSRSVGQHLQVRRSLFTEIDLDNNRGIVRRDYCRGVASVAGVYKVSDYPEANLREMRGGRIVVNCDSKNDPRTASEYEKTYEPTGERAYIAVPLLQRIAERAWTAVEKLRVNVALRESEARMQFVGERAGVGYWYWDIARDEIFWSPVCNRLHGVPEGERLTYARYLETLHPDDRPLVDQAVRTALEKGDATDYEVECRVVWPDGTVRWIHGKGSASFEKAARNRTSSTICSTSRASSAAR